MQPEQARIRALSVVTALSSALWVGQAWVIAFVFGALVGGSRELTMIWTGALGFFAIGALRAALDAFAEVRLERCADRIIGCERMALLKRQQHVSPYDPGAASSAGLAALVVDKLAFLTPFVTRFTPAVVRVGVVPALILIVAFSMSWAVGLILLVSGPLIPVFMALVGMAAQKASEQQMDEIAGMNNLLLERLSALVDVRLLDANETIAEQFTTGAERLRQQTMSVLRIAFLSSTVLEFFSAVGVAMVAVYVGFALLGELPFGAYATPLSPFEGIFLLMLAPEFFQPLRDSAAAWHDRAAAAAVARDIAALKDRPAQDIIVSGASAQDITVQGRVTWSGLRFAGPPEFDVADGDVASGEAVALTGFSGSGKSTLIAALGGIASPIAGTVCVDGVVLGPASVQGLRAQMAWMPQEPRFFAASILQNLTLGDASLQPDGRALKLASADQVIARLPQGLETVLSENGAGVSGGEARRLMLARVAVRNPRIVLADEPTADLDDETAAQVIDGLRQLNAAGATLIAATHDPRLIAALDREIRL